MLDIDYIRSHVDAVKENCSVRNVRVDIDRILELDVARRTKITQISEYRAKRNEASKSKPSPEEIEALRSLGTTITTCEKELAETEAEYNVLMLQVPNQTHPSSPRGGEEAFETLIEGGTIPTYAFTPKDHEELLVGQGLLDFERATKVAGSKFYFVQGDMVRLNHALLNYAMDVVTPFGYQLMETPDLARDEILTGIGFNPRGPETQVY
ncbi:MAG: serine--tRNA ligase, partial [Candidatus Pacebacteria bacterium]|nr:serine--tRNA ligase [Candidatus Paceibacterota bacterium]